MRDRELKNIALAALRPEPDFSRVPLLHRCGQPQIKKLLRWLDQSGLALYLYNSFRQNDATESLPTQFRRALEHRSEANRARTLDMIAEFQRVLLSLERYNARFCALKGFTLIPDFVSMPSLRHQTDLDFLVAPESVDNAKEALSSCGYSEQPNPRSGELVFATPLLHVPSPEDDIYASPRHREIDLRISLQLEEHGVRMDMAPDCFERVQTKTSEGVTFPCLAPADMFCLQVMHAFNHFLGSWVRLSWLLEIGHFIGAHHGDAPLWDSIRQYSGESPLVRNAFGLIISLTNRLFPRPIPKSLDQWCLQPLPSRIQTWVSQFGYKSAVSDLDGGKRTLFVHREFITDHGFWNTYVRSRIFPIGRRSSIGRVTAATPGLRVKALTSRWVHGIRRATFHARELAVLSMEAIQWKYALRSAAKRRALLVVSSE